ncbi:MAG: thermonuclease family protein [Hyphomicrobiales bacterium]|nr:thermonuclease family protein [Hyphomicrobiales bacterium]MCP5372809.1 thermonuclease family protein [Hyphomicrobiales bacterium]
MAGWVFRAAALAAVLAGVLLVAGRDARADTVISGFPCVVDGDTLQIGGRLVEGRCTGGIEVRLHGILAPDAGDTCRDARGEHWPCGVSAMETLSGIIRRRDIDCYHVHGAFEADMPLVTCISGRFDVAAEMVLAGAARVSAESNRYRVEQAGAKRNRRGLWR